VGQLSRADSTAWDLQQQSDAHAADLSTQVPAPAGGDLAWQQDQIRGGYEDAASLADQPKGW
jgi:hypothetical protein